MKPRRYLKNSFIGRLTASLLYWPKEFLLALATIPLTLLLFITEVSAFQNKRLRKRLENLYSEDSLKTKSESEPLPLPSEDASPLDSETLSSCLTCLRKIQSDGNSQLSMKDMLEFRRSLENSLMTSEHGKEILLSTTYRNLMLVLGVLHQGNYSLSEALQELESLNSDFISLTRMHDGEFLRHLSPLKSQTETLLLGWYAVAQGLNPIDFGPATWTTTSTSMWTGSQLTSSAATTEVPHYPSSSEERSPSSKSKN